MAKASVNAATGLWEMENIRHGYKMDHFKLEKKGRRKKEKKRPVMVVIYILERVVHDSLGTTPFEALYGTQPNQISHAFALSVVSVGTLFPKKFATLSFTLIPLRVVLSVTQKDYGRSMMSHLAKSSIFRMLPFKRHQSTIFPLLYLPTALAPTELDQSNVLLHKPQSSLFPS